MPDEAIEVRRAKTSEQRAALALAMRSLAPEARQAVLEATRATPKHPLPALDGLVVAATDEGILGAVWAQPSPGAAAVLWPPEWVEATDARLRQAGDENLIAQAMQAIDAAGVGFTQLLFERADDPRCRAAAACGFDKVATLEYLGRALPPDEPAEPTSRLSFTPYRDADRQRLTEVLQATYIDTLDCPGLDGLRDLGNVVDSYATIGDPEGRVWLFAREGDREVGVLLLAHHPDSDQAELVYMGLRPEARGAGLGRALIDEAIRASQTMGAEQLVVAVDRKNTPARTQYEQAGFVAWAERQVYVRLLAGD